jgi:uncharacterized protein involved in type VI secretion and phage assembly
MSFISQQKGADLGKIEGVIVGTVIDNKDPVSLGRVRVQFPWKTLMHQTAWARMAAPMAGNNRGTYFIPEVGDEVLVAFEQGILDAPIVIGALWNSKDKPPETNQTGHNDRRLIKSRSGHQIILDDTAGNEKIQITDKTGNNTITIDSSTNTIIIQSGSNLKIRSKSLELEAGSTMTLKAAGTLTIQGSPVKTN